MKFEKPLSGGILIAGSLFWDEHPTRKALRKSFLGMKHAVDVPAPIRYGRLSEKRNTVTMVFSKSCTTPDMIGQGKLVPFNTPIKSIKEFDAVTKAIIKAEHKKEPGFSRFNWDWGCLAVLINPDASSQTKRLIKEYWSSHFGRGFTPNDYRIGKEKPVVSSSGMLAIEWQSHYGELDFIVVTATKPNIDPIPTPKILADYFSKDDSYFKPNLENAIKSTQDQEILSLLKNHKHQISNTNLSEKIPSDWKIQTVAESFEICNTLRLPISEKERKKIPGKYPYYGPTKIQDYINEYRVSGKYALIGEDGDHFLKWRELPMTLLVSGEFNVNNHAHLIQGNQNLTEWFFYYFNHKELTPFLTRQGAGRYKLTKDSLSKMPIAIPPYREQVAITNLLSAWDKAIIFQSKLIAQKERRKKWFMQQLLTGKVRLTRSGPGWKHVRFKEIYSQIIRKAGDEKHTLLSVTKEGIISQAEYFKKEIASEDTSPYLVVEKGDMVMSGLNFWMGSIDVLSTYEKGMVSPAYKVFAISSKNISLEFMKHFVRSQEMLRALIGSSVTGASIVRRNMDRETLDEWSFYLPDYKEQVAIAQVLNTVVKELDLLKAKSEKLQEQKKGLMQVLLTGKKRLNF